MYSLLGKKTSCTHKHRCLFKFQSGDKHSCLSSHTLLIKSFLKKLRVHQSTTRTMPGSDSSVWDDRSITTIFPCAKKQKPNFHQPNKIKPDTVHHHHQDPCPQDLLDFFGGCGDDYIDNMFQDDDDVMIMTPLDYPVCDKSIYADLSSSNNYSSSEAWNSINQVDVDSPYCDDATKDRLLINAADSVISNISTVRSAIVTQPGMWLFVCLVEEIATGQGRSFSRNTICDFYACTTHIVDTTVVPGITIYLDAVRSWDAMILESPTMLYPGFGTEALDRAYAKFLACIYWNMCKDLCAAEKEYKYKNGCSNQPHTFCGRMRVQSAFAKFMQKIHTEKLNGGSPVQLYGGSMKGKYNGDYFLEECQTSGTACPERDIFVSPMVVLHYLLPIGGKASEYAVQLQLAMVGTDVCIMWSAVDIALATLYLLLEEKMLLENDMFDRAFASCRHGRIHRGQIAALASHIRFIFASRGH